MEPILLNDILRLSAADLQNTKIRLNMPSGEGWNPLELFKNGAIQKLLDGHYFKTMKNIYSVGMRTIALIKINGSSDLWLLFHIGTVLKELEIKDSKKGAVGYEYEEIGKFKKYFGRMILKYDHTFEAGVIKAEKYINDFHVYKILPDVYDDNEFPGYEDVNVSFKELKRLIETPEWKTALKKSARGLSDYRFENRKNVCRQCDRRQKDSSALERLSE